MRFKLSKKEVIQSNGRNSVREMSHILNFSKAIAKNRNLIITSRPSMNGFIWTTEIRKLNLINFKTVALDNQLEAKKLSNGNMGKSLLGSILNGWF